MAFPVTQETLDEDILGNDKQSARGHADQHNDVNRIVNELQEKVGVDASADANSMDYKIKHLRDDLDPLLPDRHTHSNMAAINKVRDDQGTTKFLRGDGQYMTIHGHSNYSALQNIIESGLGNKYLTDGGTYETIHTHGNLTALGNIVNTGPATDFLAKDGNYYPIASGTGHDVQLDGVNLPVRRYLNFYGPGVAIYDNVGNDALDIFLDGGDTNTGSAHIHTQGINNDEWNINHNLNTKDLVFGIYDTSGVLIEPDHILFIDSNNVILYFTSPVCGKCVILTDGGPGVGGCCTSGLDGFTHSQSVVSNVWDIHHNLHNDDVILSVYDVLGDIIVPDEVRIIDADRVRLTFTAPVSGKAVVLCELAKGCDMDEGLELLRDDVSIANKTTQLNFEGPGISSVVDDGAGKVTVTVAGGGGGGVTAFTALIDTPSTYSGSATYKVVVNAAATGLEFIPDTSVSGEINIGANVGTGTGIYRDKTGVTLNFKSLLAGPNITLTDNGNDITIEADNTGSYGHTQGVANTTWSVNHNLGSQDVIVKTYDGAGNEIIPDGVLIVDNNNVTITFNSAVSGRAVVHGGAVSGGGSGEVNTASNLGAGEGVFAGKVGVDLQMKSLVAGPNITLNSTGNDITIEADNTGSYGHTQGVANTTWNINHSLGSQDVDVTIYDGSNNIIEPDTVHITDDDNLVVTFSSAVSGRAVVHGGATSGGGSGETNTASNLGGGIDLFAGKVGVDLQFKTLVNGTNTTVVDNGTTVQINAIDTNTGEVNTASNVGTGAGQVFKQKTGVDLEMKTIKAGTNVSISNDTNEVTISATGTGETNTASNLGTGEGVFASKVGVDLQMKSLIAGTNISMASTGNDITINATGGGTDELAKVSANDTTPGYLNGKLVAGSNITFTENNDGGNETLVVTSTSSGYTHQIQNVSVTGTAVTIDLALGDWVIFDLSGATGDITITLNNTVTGQEYIFQAAQGGTARNLFFPANTLQAGGGGNQADGYPNVTTYCDVNYDGTNYILAVSDLS